MTIILIGYGGGGGGGLVIDVSATAPLISTLGPPIPNISMPPATILQDGYMTAIQAATLAGLVAGSGIIAGLSGEALPVGAPVYALDSGGPRFRLANATGSGPATEVLGLNTNAVGAAGLAVTISNGGEMAIPDAQWDPTFPATTDVGKRVFLSLVSGQMTLTAPGVGNTDIRLGWVTVGGTGAVKIAIEIGEGTLV